MDWNRATLLVAQCVVMITLATLVGLGRDGAITEGLLAVSASLVGIGVYGAVKRGMSPPPYD
jgi:hypothetical protein